MAADAKITNVLSVSFGKQCWKQCKGHVLWAE